MCFREIQLRAEVTNQPTLRKLTTEGALATLIHPPNPCPRRSATRQVTALDRSFEQHKRKAKQNHEPTHAQTFVAVLATKDAAAAPLNLNYGQTTMGKGKPPTRHRATPHPCE